MIVRDRAKFQSFLNEIKLIFNIKYKLLNFDKRIYNIVLGSQNIDTIKVFNKATTIMAKKCKLINKYLFIKKFLSDLKEIDRKILVYYCYNQADEVAKKYNFSDRTIFRKIKMMNNSYYAKIIKQKKEKANEKKGL